MKLERLHTTEHLAQTSVNEHLYKKHVFRVQNFLIAKGI